MKKQICIIVALFIIALPLPITAKLHLFSGTLVDTNSQPVANAVVYVEVYANGAYDFAWTVSGSNGEIPGKGYPPLKLAVKRGSGYAYCVFSEKMMPFVMNNHRPITPKSGIDLVINDKHLHDLHLSYNPDLFHLDFPFEDRPALRARLQKKENAPLLAAFGKAYDASKDPRNGLSPDAVRKIDSLKVLLGK